MDTTQLLAFIPAAIAALAGLVNALAPLVLQWLKNRKRE
jgi:hypothetical protein